MEKEAKKSLVLFGAADHTQGDSAVIDHKNGYRFELYSNCMDPASEERELKIEVSSDGTNWYHLTNLLILGGVNQKIYEGKTAADNIRITCATPFHCLTVLYCSLPY